MYTYINTSVYEYINSGYTYKYMGIDTYNNMSNTYNYTYIYTYIYMSV